MFKSLTRGVFPIIFAAVFSCKKEKDSALLPENPFKPVSTAHVSPAGVLTAHHICLGGGSISMTDLVFHLRELI
jgi:hypothetical protein